MMEEKTLLRVSFSVGIVGILLMLVVEQWYLLPLLEIGTLDEKELGKAVRVAGKAEAVSYRAGNLFFVLVDSTGRINAVAFKGKGGLRNGEELVVEGKLERYKGKLELVVGKMETGAILSYETRILERLVLKRDKYLKQEP